jgi:hypothetical protein
MVKMGTSTIVITRQIISIDYKINGNFYHVYIYDLLNEQNNFCGIYTKIKAKILRMLSRLFQPLETGYSLLQERISLCNIAKINSKLANRTFTHIYEVDGEKKTPGNERTVSDFYKNLRSSESQSSKYGKFRQKIQRNTLVDMQGYLEAPKAAELLRTSMKQEATVCHQAMLEFCAPHWENFQHDHL